jgi:hypothetical protein
MLADLGNQATVTLWVGIGFVAIGLFFMALMLTGLWLCIASRRWPTTEGEILESTPEPDESGFRPRVKYRYGVAGRDYESQNIAYHGGTGSRDAAQAVCSRYPPGSRVRVHFHPWRPGWAVLEPGIKLHVILCLALLVPPLMVLIGVALVVQRHAPWTGE